MKINRVRELRERNNVTQEYMADKLGLNTANAYSLKERGERKFSLDEAKLVSEEFDLPIEEIFFNEELTETVIIREESNISKPA